jgi:hypothetical protein
MGWDVAIVKIRWEFRLLEQVDTDYLPLGKPVCKGTACGHI